MPALQSTTEMLRLLADPTRVRLLSLLAQDELTVAELTGVTQLAQSRVSTHLGKLKEAGLVRDRRVGANAFYSLNEMPEEAGRLWRVMLETTRDAVLEQDKKRARDVVAARARGLTWADAVAGQMERHYSPGRTWEATARGLLGLWRAGDVLDVASGDGALAELLASRAHSVTCLDISERVIEAARRRLARLSNVRFEIGDMHDLPFDNRYFDAVLMMNCLTYAEEPGKALIEAARVLRPGGQLTGVTLKRHTHDRAVLAYGHKNLGFEPKRLARMLHDAKLTTERCEVTSRETRPPHFEIITFHACKQP
ncbi:MAG TPA: metalloregulator ArsR/SmtB family transcription factor [Polyangiaceae bacterium]|nr:metalloregulator ArsR/SmtB family transcription factor [Polyangiaceae bacterium]